MGGSTSGNALTSLEKKLDLVYAEGHLSREMFHVTGIANIEPDRKSRVSNAGTEWMLTRVFAQICNRFDRPDIDIFASRLNTWLKKFVSRTTCGVRPSLLPVWSRIRHGSCCKTKGRVYTSVYQCIPVSPEWSTQTWYPTIFMDGSGRPALATTTTEPVVSTPKTNTFSPKAAAGGFSPVRDPIVRHRFSERLPSLSWHSGNKGQGNSMPLTWGSGLVSVVKKTPPNWMFSASFQRRPRFPCGIIRVGGVLWTQLAELYRVCLLLWISYFRCARLHRETSEGHL